MVEGLKTDEGPVKLPGLDKFESHLLWAWAARPACMPIFCDRLAEATEGLRP